MTIEANCYVGSRALPTLPNVARNIVESTLGLIGFKLAETRKLTILKDASGFIKPSRYARNFVILGVYTFEIAIGQR